MPPGSLLQTACPRLTLPEISMRSRPQQNENLAAEHLPAAATPAIQVCCYREAHFCQPGHGGLACTGSLIRWQNWSCQATIHWVASTSLYNATLCGWLTEPHCDSACCRPCTRPGLVTSGCQDYTVNSQWFQPTLTTGLPFFNSAVVQKKLPTCSDTSQGTKPGATRTVVASVDSGVTPV